jgi:hypothetical protein
MTICIEVATEEAAAGGWRAIPLGQPEIHVFRSDVYENAVADAFYLARCLQRKMRDWQSLASVDFNLDKCFRP